jgi:hypothetical protein
VHRVGGQQHEGAPSTQLVTHWNGTQQLLRLALWQCGKQNDDEMRARPVECGQSIGAVARLQHLVLGAHKEVQQVVALKSRGSDE